MPIGILGSLIICTILYILTCAVLVGIVPYTELEQPRADRDRGRTRSACRGLRRLVKIGAIAGLSSVMLVLLYGQTRIFYTMARDGLIPSVFANVHTKFKTPWVNTILVGLLAVGFAGFMGLDALANLTNVGTLAAFAIICITVIYLRFARPDMKRPFNMPLPVMLIVAMLGALMCLFLLMSLMAHVPTRNFFLIYLGVGFVRLLRLRHVELEARQGRGRDGPRTTQPRSALTCRIRDQNEPPAFGPAVFVWACAPARYGVRWNAEVIPWRRKRSARRRRWRSSRAGARSRAATPSPRNSSSRISTPRSRS